MPNISKEGGATSDLEIGGYVDTLGKIIRVDPVNWLESLCEAIKNYIKNNDPYNIYDVLFSFPGTSDLAFTEPTAKTLIHFEIDDHDARGLGMGDNVISAEYDNANFLIQETEAILHTINFDVGIWASARTGGVSARLQAFQMLNDIFVGTSAFRAARDSAGFEIISFGGGSFIRDDVDDIPLWRVAGMTLEVRVFSKKGNVPKTYISEIIQSPGISVQDEVPIRIYE